MLFISNLKYIILNNKQKGAVIIIAITIGLISTAYVGFKVRNEFKEIVSIVAKEENKLVYENSDEAKLKKHLDKSKLKILLLKRVTKKKLKSNLKKKFMRKLKRKSLWI
ncbi:MAG: hypothetical protein PUI85_00345 [Eubacteriales bacterium]|nr:hypothetical protein [Eubacteriales bacterium]MDY3333047.1 hypothetical protein [Gallibacter sp.]